MHHSQYPCVTVLPSAIQGSGAFAVQDIRKGAVLLRIDDSRIVDSDHPLKPEDGDLAIHLDYLPDATVVLMKAPECYINHSCDPNCFFYSANRERFVLTKRDIVVGEEILVDYALNAVEGDEWKCQCGVPGCRGYHKCDYFALPLAFQRANLPYLDPWFATIHASRIQGLLAEAC